MNHSAKTDKSTVLTIIGLITMVLLTITKVVPSSQIAGYSVFAGIAFFFIVEAAAKTRNSESGLRFSTVVADIRKPDVLLWMLLPVVSTVVTFAIGTLVFNEAFVSHVMGRTGSLLDFDKIPLLIGQVMIAALGEEIAFRGFFVGKGMKIAPFWVCAAVSSVVFAAGHIALGDVGLVTYDVATIFIDSMIFAILYRKSDNCLICAVSHALCNAAGIAVALTLF